MATICKEFTVDAGIACRFGTRCAISTPCTSAWHPCFVVDCQPGGGSRTVTFANGMVAHELLVGIHEAAHRLSYTVVGGKASHHMASAQLFAEGANRTRFVWITDVLPDALGD